MKTRFDKNHQLSYGYYECPKCEAAFYGGGEALHRKSCTEKGYGNCIYAFGPNENLHFAPFSLKDEITKKLAEVA